MASETPAPPTSAAGDAPPAPERRVLLPLALFAVTCLSTWWTGTSTWIPTEPIFASPSALDDAMGIRIAILRHWQEGLIYMGCVMGIFFAHEMGHFLMTVAYGIPASYPYFIPFPLSPIGTMGAVISMDGLKANRRELFDIGLAGPLAGLVVAVPILLYGIAQLDLSLPERGFGYDSPPLVWLLLQVLPEAWRPAGFEPGTVVYSTQLNPYYAAGWVGIFLTGVNMLPLSQLDGGHLTYTLFRGGAHWIARAFMVFAFLYIVFAGAMNFALMLLLVTVIGVDHPATADDEAELGWPRTILGFCSLAIPILCFPPRALFLAGE